MRQDSPALPGLEAPAPEIDVDALGERAELQTLAALQARVSRGDALRPAELKTLDRLREKAARPGTQLVRTVAELAQALDVSTRSVIRWKTAGMPTAPGGFDVEAVRRWRSGAPAAESEPELSPARRLVLAKAKREELRLQRERGEVIDRGLVVRDLVARALVLKGDLLALAHELPATILELVGGRMEALHELQSLLVETVEDLLDRYAEPRDFVAGPNPKEHSDAAD